MRNHRLIVLLSVVAALFVSGSLSSYAGSRAAANRQTIWNLEHAYWRFVQNGDLSAYLALWHRDFLGWPSVSAAPVHKEHITDWITSQTSKGLTFKIISFKPADIQVTGSVAVTCYWVTYKWEAKDGTGKRHTIRVTHTWIKNGSTWQIIGGMSMPES